MRQPVSAEVSLIVVNINLTNLISTHLDTTSQYGNHPWVFRGLSARNSKENALDVSWTFPGLPSNFYGLHHDKPLESVDMPRTPGDPMEHCTIRSLRL